MSAPPTASRRRPALPDVILDGSFEKTAELYEALGGLLDEKAKVEELAEYSRRTFGEMRELLRRAPPDHPVRVYYARGPKGPKTALAGSLNTEMLGYLGAVNVAADPGRNGLATVSAEQILAWDPEVSSPSARTSIARSGPTPSGKAWRRSAASASISRPAFRSAGSTFPPQSIA
jgi:iron complex transport system substrate-binding protein